MDAVKAKITIDEFLKMPESEDRYELVDGEIIAKVSPKFFHSQLTMMIWAELSSWAVGRGRVQVEWSVLLKRNDQDWVPVPDLLYVSYDRLPKNWCEDSPCPVTPELVIEIISPEQTFNQLADKAVDYLDAGIDRVWLVYPPMRSITVFFLDRPPETFRGNQQVSDILFPELNLIVEEMFKRAGV